MSWGGVAYSAASREARCSRSAAMLSRVTVAAAMPIVVSAGSGLADLLCGSIWCVIFVTLVVVIIRTGRIIES